MASSQEEQSSNPPPASPRTQLLEACAADNAEDVRRLLAEKANPNEVDRNGVTILVIATSEGFSEVAAVLVEHGADVNACDKNKETALHHAAFNSMPDVAALLCDKGADLNARRFNGATPLDCSAGRKVKQVLEERGAQTAAEMRYRDKCKKNWQSVRHARMLAANEALHHQPESDWMPLDPLAHLWRQVLGWSALGVASSLSPRKKVTSPRKDPRPPAARSTGI
mmetsp:Transcript_45546/g.106998  ORF Transcript_45546/g.106998 Transcript_45546/m.106998 type:complete len:225 (+) Transcript_45546:249-923(+)